MCGRRALGSQITCSGSGRGRAACRHQMARPGGSQPLQPLLCAMQPASHNTAHPPALTCARTQLCPAAAHAPAKHTPPCTPHLWCQARPPQLPSHAPWLTSACRLADFCPLPNTQLASAASLRQCSASTTRLGPLYCPPLRWEISLARMSNAYRCENEGEKCGCWVGRQVWGDPKGGPG